MKKKIVYPLLAFAVLLVSVFFTAPEYRPPSIQLKDCSWCTEGEDFFVRLPFPLVRFLSAGQYGMAGAYNYFQAIYFFGKETPDEKNYLSFLFERTVEHDPYFFDGYYVGSLLLGNERKNYIDSIELLQEGERNLPDEWLFSFLKGYYLWSAMGELDKAATSFRKAAAKPDAPQYLSALADTLSFENVSTEKKIRVLTRILKSIQNEQNRQKIIQMILELQGGGGKA